MFEGLLSTPFFERLNIWFIGALGVLTLYWLGKVALAARQRRRPAATLWSIAGLLLLLLAPLTEVPALFGLGAAALMLADWWPGAFVKSKQRPSWVWGLVFAVLGGGVLAVPKVTFLTLIVGLALALFGLAQLMSGLLWPKRLPAVAGWLPPSTLGKVESPTFGSEWRWRAQQTPDVPDLSVSVGQGYLTLRNDSVAAVHLRGWSPTHRNAFLALDKVIPVAAEHRLSREPRQSGVRVWYTLPGQQGVRVLRADWHEGNDSGGRVLN